MNLYDTTAISRDISWDMRVRGQSSVVIESICFFTNIHRRLYMRLIDHDQSWSECNLNVKCTAFHGDQNDCNYSA